MKQKKILLAVLFVVLFCGSFVFLFMYFQSQRQLAAQETLTQKETPIQKEIPLPEVSFSDANDNKLPDDEIRTGKVVLIFLMNDCRYCESESEFLNEVAAKQKDIKFYGLVSLGDKKKQLETAAAKYPIRVVYDDSNLFAKLGINRVPIKIYLEDGIIKKAWDGASVDEGKKANFISWLEGV